MRQPDMFPEVGNRPPPLKLYMGDGDIHANYLRRRMGQNMKITLRSRERGGRIVATIYSGEDDARYILNAVNQFTVSLEKGNTNATTEK